MTVRDLWDATTIETQIAIEKDGFRYYTNTHEFFTLLDAEVKHIKGEVREWKKITLVIEV